MTCKKEHRYDAKFKELPVDQGGQGRHHCAGCAYEKGYADGYRRLENIAIELEKLPLSQAGNVRHKSPHAAYALGYYDGVKSFYEELYII